MTALARRQFLHTSVITGSISAAPLFVTATGCEELNHIPTSVTHKQ